MCYTMVLYSGKGVGSSVMQLGEIKVVKSVLYNTLCVRAGNTVLGWMWSQNFVCVIRKAYKIFITLKWILKK